MVNTLEHKNPIDYGKKTIKDFFEENVKIICSQTLMSEISLTCSNDEFNLPPQNKFFYTFKHKVYLCTKKKKNKLGIKLATTFDVVSIKECELIYNDRSEKIPTKYYLATFSTADGKIEKDIEISNNSKSDYKQFQSTLNGLANGFLIDMKESEFKAYIETFISPKVAEKVTIYTNAGLTPDRKFLYENALATMDGIIWADEDGYIKVAENSYVKLNKAEHCLPRLYKSDKTGVEIAYELMTNIKETWNENLVAALLALGNMVMAIYFEDFIKRYGVPTLILYGDSGSGKSTLMIVGLSIFGLSKDSLSAGSSTIRSNEFFTSHYNCCIIGIDDVKGDTLKSQNFISMIKRAYKGISRSKMTNYGKEVDCVRFCSPLAYSTNESLPDLKEVISRLNVIEIFGNKFKADKFKYHEFNKNNANNLRELSLILPEFLKFDKDTILNMYEDVFEKLKQSVQDTQNRIINNISYAYVGILLLSIISDVEFENLEEQIIEFAQKQAEYYNNINTPVEKVLHAIAVLTDLNYLQCGIHFKIFDVDVNGIPETHIRFRKNVILSVINKYYAHDKSLQIDVDSFLRYAQNHTRFRGNNISVRYNDNVASSICFNISGMNDFVHIAPHGVITPASYIETKEYLESCNKE